jgi:hypothetical protein
MSIVGPLLLLGCAIVQSPEGSGGRDCSVTHESVDRLPDSIHNLAPFVDRILIGEVDSIDPGRFNTGDGQMPPADRPHGPDWNPRIVTPIVVDVVLVVAGDGTVGPSRLVIDGGSVGCIQHIIQPTPRVQLGASYVLLTQPSVLADMTRDPTVPALLDAWPVTDDGLVETEQDGTLTIAALQRAFTDAASASQAP